MRVPANTSSETTKAQELLDRLQRLPPLPEVAHEIIQRLDDEFIDGNTVADIVEKDPAISARLIGLANSAYFGLREPVSNMRDVVNRVLGTNTVRTLSFALATQQLFDSQSCQAFDTHVFWTRCLTCGLVCRQLASVTPNLSEPDREFAYLLGLCHNLGLMALVHLRPKELNSALENPMDSDDLDHALQNSLGLTPPHVTWVLSQNWQLPKPICAAYENRANGCHKSHRTLSVLLEASIHLSRPLMDSDQDHDYVHWGMVLDLGPETVQATTEISGTHLENIQATAATLSG